MTFLVTVSFVLMGIGVLVVFTWRRKSRVRRAVWRTPVSAVEDVTEPGPVAVHGTATKAGQLSERAPFSPRTYLVAPWAVQRYGNDDAGSAWRDIASGHEAVPFTLADDTGEITVDLTGDADIAVDTDELTEKHRVEPGDRRPKAVEVFELQHDDVDPQREGAASSLKFGTLKDTRRYMQALIMADDECYLLGEAEWRSAENAPGSEPDSNDDRGEGSRELVVTASDDGPSTLSTKDPDVLRSRFGWGSLYVALGVLIAAAGVWLNLIANGVL